MRRVYILLDDLALANRTVSCCLQILKPLLQLSELVLLFLLESFLEADVVGQFLLILNQPFRLLLKLLEAITKESEEPILLSNISGYLLGHVRAVILDLLLQKLFDVLFEIIDLYLKAFSLVGQLQLVLPLCLPVFCLFI